jgi:hypothetical protein
MSGLLAIAPSLRFDAPNDLATGGKIRRGEALNDKI